QVSLSHRHLAPLEPIQRSQFDYRNLLVFLRNPWRKVLFNHPLCLFLVLLQAARALRLQRDPIMDLQPLTVIPKPLTSLRSLEAAITLKGGPELNAWFILPIPAIIVPGHSSIVASLESTSRHTPDLSNALTLTANSKSEVSGVSKILIAISATCTSQPILWNLTALSNAALKIAFIARKALKGRITVSDISGNGIQIWAEILYKQPINLICTLLKHNSLERIIAVLRPSNRTLHQRDKWSVSSPVPLWTKNDAVEWRVHILSLMATFDEVYHSLVGNLEAFNAYRLQDIFGYLATILIFPPPT
ncbi:hypothetical protein K469DRAFT_792594, partial [Zopfia rhizophila CBS 207.26]